MLTQTLPSSPLARVAKTALYRAYMLWYAHTTFRNPNTNLPQVGAAATLSGVTVSKFLSHLLGAGLTSKRGPRCH
jgi:hypothetical protein